MTKDEFEDWVNDPVTKEFRKYLIDSSDEEAEILKDTIISGEVVPVEDQYRIVIMNVLFRRIVEIDYEEIAGFYKQD